jgi:hypothetical protein
VVKLRRGGEVRRGKRARCEGAGQIGAGAAVFETHRRCKTYKGASIKTVSTVPTTVRQDPDIIIHSSRAAGWLRHWLLLRLLPQRLLAT